jgi:hypothetical protein
MLYRLHPLRRDPSPRIENLQIIGGDNESLSRPIVARSSNIRNEIKMGRKLITPLVCALILACDAGVEVEVGVEVHVDGDNDRDRDGEGDGEVDGEVDGGGDDDRCTTSEDGSAAPPTPPVSPASGVSTTMRLNTPSIMDLGYQFTESCSTKFETTNGDLAYTAAFCAHQTWGIVGYYFDQPSPWFTDDLGAATPSYSKLVEFHGDDIKRYYQCHGGRLFIHKGMKVLESGVVQPDPNNLYVGCTNSAPGKAARWGFHPWSDLKRFEGGIRVVRADYCADGTPYTDEGTRIGIEVYGVATNRMFTNRASSQKKLEAVWDDEGAICVENPRLGGDVPWCTPTCTELGGLSAIKQSSMTEIIAITWIE